MSDRQPGKERIVHFLFEPGNGGLDRVAILLANGMASRGIPAELWLSQREGPLADLIADNVTVRLVPTVSFGSRGLKLFLQIPALARMIRRYRPKAILSAGNQSNLTVALAKRLALGTDTKVVQKTTNPIVRPRMGKIRAYERRLRFMATAWLGDLCLTLSEADVRSYSALMPSVAKRFRSVRNPYVSDAMLDLGKQRSDESGTAPLRLLCVGRLEFQKDHATAFRSLARLKHLEWRLDLLGNGPLEQDLRDLATQLGIIDRVTFNGFHSNPIELYAKSDALVLSSRWEGLPAVPLEAMACGCDVVTTDCSPGLTDLLAPLGRPLVPVGDDAALARGIESLFNDRTPAVMMHKIAQQYSIASSIEDHTQKVANLVETGQPASGAKTPVS